MDFKTKAALAEWANDQTMLEIPAVPDPRCAAALPVSAD
jgi:hypothetical protein